MEISKTLKAIHAACLECVDGEAEVRRCAFFACPQWPFRMGKNPFPLSEAQQMQRQKAAEKSSLGLSRLPASPEPPVGVDPPSVRGPNELEPPSERPSIDQLRSWAGRNLAMASVEAPDPREMTVAELEALGCTNRWPSRALHLAAKINNMTYAQRRAAGLQGAVPPPHSWRK